MNEIDARTWDLMLRNISRTLHSNRYRMSHFDEVPLGGWSPVYENVAREVLQNLGYFRLPNEKSP